MKTALTIAGSDCSGGAGIQADIKTMIANGVYAMSAVTALTAQNTMGITAISEVDEFFLRQQLDSVFEDIFPDAVKTGIVANERLIDTIVDRLSFYGASNIVVDPVMISTSGSRLISEEAVASLRSRLLPIADIVTPNIPEACVISGMDITDRKSMEEAAIKIHETYGCAVLLKGGHSLKNADDVLAEKNRITWFDNERIENPNTHGTGCTLSSAIAANLAKGLTLSDSVKLAKSYVSGALSCMMGLGKGNGPINHAFDIRSRYTGENI